MNNINKNIQDFYFSRLFVFANNNDNNGEASIMTDSVREEDSTRSVDSTAKKHVDANGETTIEKGTHHGLFDPLPNIVTEDIQRDYENNKLLMNGNLTPEERERRLAPYRDYREFSERMKKTVNNNLYGNGELVPEKWDESNIKAQNWFRVRDAIDRGLVYRSMDGKTFHRFGENEEGSEIDDAIKSFYGNDALRVYGNKQDYDNAVAENYIRGRALSQDKDELTFSAPEIEYLKRNPEFAKNIARWTAQNYGYGINLDDFKDNPELQKSYTLQVLDRLKREGRLGDAANDVIVKGFNGRNNIKESSVYTGLNPKEIRAVDYAFTNNLINRAGYFIDGYDKVIKQEDVRNLPESLKEISRKTPSTIIWRYHPSFKSGVYLVQDHKNPKLWRQYREDGTAIGGFGGKATSFKLEDGVRVNPQEHQQELEQIENWRNLSRFGNRVDLEEIQHKADSLDSPFFVDANGNVQTAYGTQSLNAWASKNGFNPFDYSKTTDVIDKSGKLTPRAQRYIERYNAMSPEQKAEYDSKNPWFKQFLSGVNRSENSALNRTIAQPGLKWKDWSDTQKFGTMAGLGLGSLAFMSMLGKNKKDWFDYLMMLGVPIASIFGGSYLGNYLDPRTNPGTYNAKAYADYIKNAQKQAADAAKAANSAASGSK